MDPITIVRKPEKESGWAIADMRPGEVAMWKGQIIISLKGGGNVELHTYDEHRQTPGEKASKLRKHFFFNMDKQIVQAIVGSDPIEPHTMYVEVRPGNPDFATASNREKFGGIATPPEIVHKEAEVPYEQLTLLDNEV